MQATSCANTQYLNAYLREQDRAEKRADWIDLEASVKFAEMMPLSIADLQEGVSEVIEDKAIAKQLAEAFNGGSDADIGKLVRASVKAYWLKYCTQQAEDDYDDGAAERDYGRY